MRKIAATIKIMRQQPPPPPPLLGPSSPNRKSNSKKFMEIDF